MDGSALLEGHDKDTDKGVTPPSVVVDNASNAQPRNPVGGRQSALATLRLCVGCAGIVFGDLGTSPIYAFREVFAGKSFANTEENVLGVLSMIFYALMLVVTIKYLFILCYVEGPGGAGGTLALVRVLQHKLPWARTWLVWAGLLAISLFLSDSIITPGVSVLSAVEGVAALAPAMAPFCPIIAMGVLACLFYSQRYGPGSLGAFFGPIMVIFFLSIATLGLTTVALTGCWIVFAALNPAQLVFFIWREPWGAWKSLQSVILAITGAEALYADMALFGRRPIQLTWMSLVVLSLTLCYCGQGAVLLRPEGFAPELVENPFFALAPNTWIRSALVVLSTAATLIASQSVISGAFAVLNEAISLGLAPRLTVMRTSASAHGHIYIPALNTFLTIGCITLVGLFRRSSAMASAYGLAVCGAMLVDTLLLVPVLYQIFHWRAPLAVATFAVYAVCDSLFFAAGASKFFSGAFLPCGLSVFFCLILSTYSRGKRLSERWISSQPPLSLASVVLHSQTSPPEGSGSVGVHLTRAAKKSNAPFSLQTLFQRYGGPLHPRTMLLHLQIDHHANEPRPLFVEVAQLAPGVWAGEAHWDGRGAFDLGAAVAAVVPGVRAEEVTFYLHRESPIAHHMSLWRASVYAVLLEIGRGTLARALPVEKTIEMVRQVHC